MQPLPPEPDPVGPNSLLEAYRVGREAANARYGEKRIFVTLQPRSYKVRQGAIDWYTGLEGAPPAIIFEGALFGKEAPNRQITIVGTCRGIVDDGIRRKSGVTWCVRVVECQIKP